MEKLSSPIQGYYNLGACTKSVGLLEWGQKIGRLEGWKIGRLEDWYYILIL